MQSSPERSRFRRRLLTWFDRHQRDLPWRTGKSPYRTWVSEIMLQQTQVVTVVEYFNRFVARFPDVTALAEADESDVLKLWEGLGYYRRARQMHAAARQMVAEHAARFPETFDEVLALPGIGRYTAGAILSIAAGQPHPILEGNTIRVFSRLLNFTDDVTTGAARKTLWAFSESLLSKNRPGDLNQALMELGSQICSVKSPDCLHCPVSRHCQAFQTGDPQALPHKGGRKTGYEDLQQAAVVIRRGPRLVVRLCGPDEHWSGLWDFPRFTLGSAGRRGEIAEIVDLVKRQTGLSVQVDQPFISIRHAVTRFRIRLDGYIASHIRGRLKSSRQLRWVTMAELDELAMSTTGRKIARKLASSNPVDLVP